MAELLIKAIDATHSDPVKDARGCWKRGDVVAAFDDGHEWGRLEALPPEQGGKFVIIRLPGVTLAELRGETIQRTAFDFLDPERDESGEVVGRRAMKVDLDALLAAEQQTARRDGRLTLSKSRVAQLATVKPTKRSRDDATNDLGGR